MNWFQKRKLRSRLSQTDYDLASRDLGERFAGSVIPKELARKLDNFQANPCFETACAIIEHNPEFEVLFRESRPGGICAIQEKVRADNAKRN